MNWPIHSLAMKKSFLLVAYLNDCRCQIPRLRREDNKTVYAGTDSAHVHSFILEWNVPLLLCLRWWTVMMSNCTISSSFASLRDDLSLYHHKYYNLASRKEYLVTYVENKDKRILCSFFFLVIIYLNYLMGKGWSLVCLH